MSVRFSKGRWVPLVVAVLLVAVGAYVMVARPFAPSEQTVPVPTRSSQGASSATAAPSLTPTAHPAPSHSAATRATTPTPSPTQTPSCAKGSGAFVPKRMSVKAVDLDIPVVSASVVSLGNGKSRFPDPQNFNPHQAVWVKQTAKPGSESGTVFITVHTYSSRIAAAGNVLGKNAREGDLIKLYDAKGVVRACYEVVATGAAVTWDADKVPLNDCVGEKSICRQDGEPMLTIEFCWGYDSSTGEWPQRRHVIAKEVP